MHEKKNYEARQEQARKSAKSLEGGKGDFRLARVTDLTTYMRHQQERPGCWGDKGFVKDFEKSNPEVKVKHWEQSPTAPLRVGSSPQLESIKS